MLIFLFVVIGLSLLIVGHEAGHFFAAKSFGLRVDEFGFGFPPRMFAWKKGETEYSLNWLPFGGFVKIAGETEDPQEFNELPEQEKKRLFIFQPAWKRIVIVLAGIAVNFLIGWLLISAVLMVGSPKALVISEVQPNTPAAAAGLQTGDVVKDYVTAQPFIDFMNSHKGQEITLNIIRGGQELAVKVTPRTVIPAGQGAIGIALAEAGEGREPFFSALYDGMIRTGLLAWLTLATFGNLIAQLFTHASLVEGVVGPVGIFSVAAETSKIGFVYFVTLLAQISISLAVFNVLPFRPLDGGLFFQTIVEKISGGAMSKKAIAVSSAVGFGFLILLFVLVTVRDVGRLF